MTQYLKLTKELGFTRYVPVEAPARRKRPIVRTMIFGFTFGAVLWTMSAYVGAIRAHGETAAQAAFLAGDSAARTDYADLVNSCYDHTRNSTADALYSCIAAGT